MSERLQHPLPLWTLHFHLIGGTRRLLQTYLVYLTVGIGGWSLLRYVLREELSLADFAGGCVSFLAAGQLALLILGGTSALHRALLRDYESKMIESHRLTPLSNVTVILGYLFGPTLQILGLFLINVLAGLLLCQLAGLSLPRWLLGNALVLLGAVMIWSAAIAFAMRPAKPFNPLTIIIAASLFASPLWILPGVGVFTGLYGAGAGYLLMTTTKALPAAILAALVLWMLVLTVFWILIGAARYRRPDLPALAGLRGLILMVLWLLLAFGGLLVLVRTQDALGVNIVADADLTFPWIASLILTILVAVPAISGSVAYGLLRAERRPIPERSARLSDSLVTLLAAILTAVPVILMARTGFGLAERFGSRKFCSASWLAPSFLGVEASLATLNDTVVMLASLWTVLAVTIALLTVRAVMRLTCAVLRRAWMPALLFLVLYWAAFPLLDLMIAVGTVEEYGDPFSIESRSWIFACSPVGTIIGVWSGIPIPYEPGLLTQLAILLALTGVARHFWNFRLRNVAAYHSARSADAPA